MGSPGGLFLKPNDIYSVVSQRFMTVNVTVIGHDGSEVLLEGFEDEHTLQDLRDYWEEYFITLDWVKNLEESNKTVEIGEQEAVPWADVAESTLGDLFLELEKTLRLMQPIYCGGISWPPPPPPPKKRQPRSPRPPRRR